MTARTSLIDCSNVECSGIYNALLEALKPIVSAILTARKSHDVHMYWMGTSFLAISTPYHEVCLPLAGGKFRKCRKSYGNIYMYIYIYRFIIHSLWALSESRWHTSQIIRYYCSIDFGINKNCAYLRFRVTEGSFLRHLDFPITFLAIWTVRTSGDFHQNVGAFGRQSFPCLSNDAPMRTHRNTRQSKVHVASLAMTGKSTGVRSCH